MDHNDQACGRHAVRMGRRPAEWRASLLREAPAKLPQGESLDMLAEGEMGLTQVLHILEGVLDQLSTEGARGPCSALPVVHLVLVFERRVCAGPLPKDLLQPTRALGA